MTPANNLELLSHFGDKFIIFSSRLSVNRQLLAIVLVFLLAWLLAKAIWAELRKRFPQWSPTTWQTHKLNRLEFVGLLLNDLLVPILSLISLHLTRIFFAGQGWEEGLLWTAMNFLRVYFLYRFVLAAFFTAITPVVIRRFERSLFAPLFAVYVLVSLVSLSTNLEQLAQIVLVNLFNTPITLGDIWLMTVGLYFWVVIANLVEQLGIYLFTNVNHPESGTPQAVSLLLRYFLIGLGIVLILGYVGVNTTALAAITGGLSVGVGFGLQQVISNFFSGILLLFEGALKPGDLINVNGSLSRVIKLGIRATTVRVLGDNSEKIIPNQTFFTSEVTTYTGSDRLIYRSLQVGASYSSDPKYVIEILLRVAEQHPLVLNDPPPISRFINFGDSSLNFELKFCIDNPLNGATVTSELGCAIWQAFAEHGIEIPFPQRVIHTALSAQSRAAAPESP